MIKESVETQVVTFRIGVEIYCMEIGRIREIIKPQDITPVPGMTDAVKGIINLRGEIIPVIELAAALNVKKRNSDKTMVKPRVIILDPNQGGYGILVDEVMQVIKVQSGAIHTRMGCEQFAANDNLVSGIIHAEGKIIIYLDPSEILKGLSLLTDGSTEADQVSLPI